MIGQRERTMRWPAEHVTYEQPGTGRISRADRVGLWVLWIRNPFHFMPRVAAVKDGASRTTGERDIVKVVGFAQGVTLSISPG